MKNSPITVVFIDGNAIMHRAYHALPPLTDKKGNLIHAVYGFLSILLTIVKKIKPTHLVVCFDRPEPTFRKGMYAGYQANRPKMDDSLSNQFPPLKKLLSAMKISLYEKAGYEADDVIGSLVYQVKNQLKKRNEKFQTIIVTGDKDILQLVDTTTFVYMPIKGLSNGKLFTPSEVKKTFGVKPEQIVDYKALIGDPSDNYPGVYGIGPKTAQHLLHKFKTFENLYNALLHKDKRLNCLKEKTIKALSTYAEDASMAKKLAKIVHDVPVTLDLNGAKLRSFDNPDALEMFQKYGFVSLVKRIMNMENDNSKLLETKKKDKKDKKENNTSHQLSLV